MKINERLLSTCAGTQYNISLSMPMGAYIGDIIIKNGYVYLCSLEDDAKPIVNRTFHIVGAFTPAQDNSKRHWYIGKVEYPQPPHSSGTPFWYYILESEK